MTALEHSEESCAIGREPQILPRRQGAFDSMNAHSQADEPPLSFVMEFNAAEREWHEAQDRLNKMLKTLSTACAVNEAVKGPAALRHADDQCRARSVGPPKGSLDMARAKHATQVTGEQITQSILVFRGHRVLLDEDLAPSMECRPGCSCRPSSAISRFPGDFMFQLTAPEWAVLKSRIVISRSGQGGRR
jgi:hypothetical protein